MSESLSAPATAASMAYLAPKRLLPFCMQMMPAYQNPPHLRLLSQYLEHVESGKIRRLLVSMPPRHGKSQLTSIFFPAWFLGRNPDKRIILSAHTGFLAEKFSRQARNLIIDSRWPFPDVTLAKDSHSVTEWNIEGRRGGFLGMGIGGAITGSGAHLALIDDPITDLEEANSKTALEKQDDWYKSVLYTRLEDGAAVVMTMTRWNEGDLAGRRLDEMQAGGEKWTELRLPAIAESGDALGREPGAPLWPEKYDAELLASMQRTMGPRVWSALYQQRPVPGEGLYFKSSTFRYFTSHEGAYVLEAPSGERAVQNRGLFVFTTADLAISEKSTADYTAIITCGITPEGELLVLDVDRSRHNAESLEITFEKVYAVWRPDAIYIESVGFQSYLIQNLKRALPDVTINEIRPDRDKVVRAMAIAERLEGGKVYFRKNAPWLADFEHELLTFPAGRHDDQVDALAYAGVVHSKRSLTGSAPYAQRRRILNTPQLF